MNKYGLVLNSYVYAAHRIEYVTRSLTSLNKTNVEGLEQPILQLTYKQSNFDYQPFILELEKKFWMQVDNEADICRAGLASGIDPTFINSVNNMLLLYPEVTHVTYLTDDILYNAEWLQQLDQLIHRHPDATAWTVYKSSHTRHHRTIGKAFYKTPEITDHKVTSIAGVGTMTKKEWEEYNLDGRHQHGYYSVPPEAGGGNTVDLHHAFARQGERWATGRDYWQHIGYIGRHSHSNIDDAVDFVGL